MTSSRSFLTAGIAAVLVVAGLVLARAGSPPPLQLQTGEQIWNSACAACHGPDGKGAPETMRGFAAPDSFPDFSRCDQTTAETDWAYKDVVTHGGPARGFSQIMPSFQDALTEKQIDEVVHYLRGFCKKTGWPRAELNLPRAIVTEKAYPEDELVISSGINLNGQGGGTTHIIHEQRFGVKNQVEVDVPINYANQTPGGWVGGIGDTTVGVKRTMFSSLKSGSILALQGELSFPSGDAARGFGSGSTSFVTFAAFDQLFQTKTFVQLQGGSELPFHTNLAPQSVFFNAAVGQMLARDHFLGRMFTPMFEFVSNRDLVTGAKTSWDVVPQMQVTVSRRQHVMASLGFDVPAINTAGRNTQVVFYVLWDWQDGKITEGW